MIYRCPYPDVAIPEIPLAPFIFRDAVKHPDKPALIDGPSGRTYTFGALWDAIRRVAVGLHRRGFGPGDVLAIYSPNCPEYAICFYAVTLFGGIVTTANPVYTEDELAHQLEDAGAKYLVTIPLFLDKGLRAAHTAGIAETFVIGEGAGATPFADLLIDAGELPDVSFDVHEQVAALPYSSGTTGLPKGVMLTHFNLVANVCQTLAVSPLGEDERVIGILPFYHSYGMVVVMSMCLRAGATVVTLPRFELDSFLKTLQDYRITTAFLVPPIILALARYPGVDAYDLSALGYVTSGAAPLPEVVARNCAERLNVDLAQGYGLTETGPVSHFGPRGGKTPVTSVGTAIPNTEYRIVDVGTGKDAGRGGTGEVWIRGPQVMKGYHNRPDATATMIDAEGWLHTGDIGYSDDDLQLFVVDRVKELIKYKGLQVAPAELEAVVQTHPAVADAAVIPSPDEEAGEVPKAFVVLKSGMAATESEIIAHVAARVASFKKVRLVEFIDKIPKVPSGKILRRVLVERERAVVAAQFSGRT